MTEYVFGGTPLVQAGVDPHASRDNYGRWRPPSDLPSGTSSFCGDCAIRGFDQRCAGCPRPRPARSYERTT
jgi:hypothetical protein